MEGTTMTENRRHIVEALLRAGANAEENWKGRTPLMWAATWGHVGMINALTASPYPAKIDVQDLVCLPYECGLYQLS